MNKQNIASTITPKDKIVARHISDGSELVPAEIQANTNFDSTQLINTHFPKGYVVDDEGVVNNYATEPDVFMANYPSPEQQKRYLFWGGGAILLVVITLLIGFAVSYT